MTTTANTGDPLGNQGLVPEEEDEAVGDERYASDSNDDDVDRYVFLARQPAPGEASDDDDAIPGGGRGVGGGCARKRYVQEIVADALPAAKKARPGLSAPRLHGASAEDSGSDREEPVRSAERFRGGLDHQGKKNKKRRRCGGEPGVQGASRGKRSTGADIEEGQEKTSMAAGAEAPAGDPRRFVCSLCGKCFGSYQALGGHVHLGHTKKARNAITAASRGGVTGNGGCNEKVAMADGAGHGKEKAAVAAAYLQDVDGSTEDSYSNEEMFTDAANHGEHRGHGDIKGEKITIAKGHDDDDGSGNDGGTERKAAVGRWGNANSIVQKRQQYRCEVCGKECLSGQALGGHMRKHRKLPPHDAGKERSSPEVSDGAGHGQTKIAVAASRGESDGDGKKIVSAAACHQGVDSSTDDEMFIDAANNRGIGNVEGEKFTVATSHHDAYISGKSNGTERKVAGIGNVNNIIRKTQYRCEVCGKECLSGQALGGHMRKHPKLPPHNGSKKRRSPEKTTVAESPWESDGDEKKTNAEACLQDVDSSSGDSDSNDEMFIDAANHYGKGNVQGEKFIIPQSHDNADGNGDRKGTEGKAVVGRCHELATSAIGNANCKTQQYRCEMCGKEYLSGQALGGHMRMHRKLAPHNGSKEGRSPELNGIPDQRAAVISGNRQLSKTTNSPFDGGLIGWL